MYQNLEVELETLEEYYDLQESFDNAKKSFGALRLLSDGEFVYQVKGSYGKFNRVGLEDAIKILEHIARFGLLPLENNYNV